LSAQIEGRGSAASAPEDRDATAFFSAAKSLAGVTRFLGGAHHLADKTFVADTSRPNANIVVALRHDFAPCQTPRP
jgi:hypothetical protein